MGVKQNLNFSNEKLDDRNRKWFDFSKNNIYDISTTFLESLLII